MSIRERLNDDLKIAMRNKDSKKLETLRLITAAIKQVEVDERIVPDEQRLLMILDKMNKQRKESIVQFQKAQRQDLIDQEQFELDIISQYLPEQLSPDAIAKLISDTIKTLGAEKISDMGKVMAILKPKIQGCADISIVSSMVKAKLT